MCRYISQSHLVVITAKLLLILVDAIKNFLGSTFLLKLIRSAVVFLTPFFVHVVLVVISSPEDNFILLRHRWDTFS